MYAKIPDHYRTLSPAKMKIFIHELWEDSRTQKLRAKITHWEHTFINDLHLSLAFWDSNSKEHPLSEKQLATLRSVELKLYV